MLDAALHTSDQHVQHVENREHRPCGSAHGDEPSGPVERWKQVRPEEGEDSQAERNIDHDESSGEEGQAPQHGPPPGCGAAALGCGSEQRGDPRAHQAEGLAGRVAGSHRSTTEGPHGGRAQDELDRERGRHSKRSR